MTDVYDPDPIQNAITTEAMKLVGTKTLRVRRSIAADPTFGVGDKAGQRPPRWVVVDSKTDAICSLMGIAPYGGETKAAAIADARRLAGKWDWEVEA